MRLCLNMIVKNESERIERCLTSVAPWIKCYSIVDTGSTDDTMAKVKDFFGYRGIPGGIHQGPFGDFSTARNLALECGRRIFRDADAFDYYLLCDADMELRVDDEHWADNMATPCYRLLQRNTEISYWNARLLKRDAAARYVGATHEYLSVEGVEDRQGAWFWDHADGANRPGKLERDLVLLDHEIAADPGNARAWFYKAQTLREMGRLREAIECYEKRADLGGWTEEVFYAHLAASRCLRSLGK